MISFDLTDELKLKIRKLSKKYPKRVQIINKKIREIVSQDIDQIDMHYKNLRNEFKDRKRVHLDRHFVMTFRVFKEEDFILFLDLDHHDDVYKN